MPSIAVLGASQRRDKYGNKCVRAYRKAGWEVYPVNLSGEEVEGLATFRSLREVPVESLDRVSVYLPPPVTLELLGEIAGAGPRQVWFNPGAADAAVLARARELGLAAVSACSIVDIGFSPAQFP